MSMRYQTIGWACMSLMLAMDASAQASANAGTTADQDQLPTVSIKAASKQQPAQSKVKLKGQTDEQDDVAQLLKQVSGVQVNRQSGTAGTVLVRGLGGSRLPVLKDGIALEAACNHGMDPATSYIDPEAVDQGTVIKGPSTVRYAGVLAGALVFERQAPPSDAPSGLKLSQTLAAFGKQQTHAEGLLNAEAAWAKVTNRHLQSDDERDGHGQRIPSSYLRDNHDLELGWRLTEEQTLSATLTRSDGWAVYPAYHMDGTRFLSDSLGLQWRAQRLSPWVKQAEAQVRWQSVDHAMDNFTLRGEEGTYQPDESNRLREVMQQRNRSRAASLHVDLDMAEEQVLRLGLDSRLDSYDAQNHLSSTQCFDFGSGPTCLSNDPGLKPYYDIHIQQTGVYAEWLATMGPTSLSTGLRVDSRESRAGDIRDFSANANPVKGQDTRRHMTLHSAFARAEHRIDAQWQAHAAIGQAERGPDYVEIGSLQGYDLAVEQHKELNAGLRYSTRQLSASVNGFINLIDNFMLVTSGTSAKSVDAVRRGLESELNWAASPALTLGGNLSLVWAANKTDHVALAQTPPTQGRLYAAWKQDAYGLKLITRMADGQQRIDRNHGSTNGLDVAATPGFSVWDIQSDYKFSKQVQLAAGIDNVFDRYYVEHLNHSSSVSWANLGSTLPSQVPEAGQRWWVKLGVSLP
ncbi:MAG: TonB-dependent receptor [Aquabacterium sp.]|uniref:TonB-dependent receptor domain-containing protein n=1 Tax=Aquabacterium sp. TaxID=1872578 RepID=UPI0012113D39|nr:TonB-dependent receptor [Aquabacterium sp.]TAK95147.1 MAG: TonB-dependent receptor [Aquabacterium sp.]